MNTKDITSDQSFFGLFKGDPGAGKSIAAASFPEPVYVMDFDLKINSLRNWYLGKRDFEYDQFPDLITSNRKLDEFERGCQYKTIMVDSITSFCELAIKSMIMFRNPSSSSKTVRAGVAMTEIEDYGGETRAVVELIDQLKKISMRQKVNVIFNAHVLTTEYTKMGGELTNITRQLVTMGKKIAAIIPKNFDEAYHFGVRPSISDPNKIERVCITESSGSDWARNSIRGLPRVIDWTNKDFYKILQGYMKGAELFS